MDTIDKVTLTTPVKAENASKSPTASPVNTLAVMAAQAAIEKQAERVDRAPATTRSKGGMVADAAFVFGETIPPSDDEINVMLELMMVRLGNSLLASPLQTRSLPTTM